MNFVSFGCNDVAVATFKVNAVGAIGRLPAERSCCVGGIVGNSSSSFSGLRSINIRFLEDRDGYRRGGLLRSSGEEECTTPQRTAPLTVGRNLRTYPQT